MKEAKTACACGSRFTYAECCKPYHDRLQTAPTAVAMMRSRYAAFVHGKIDYLVETTLPDRRTTDLRRQYLSIYESVRWIGLEIVSTSQGGTADKTGKVEFKASYSEGGHINIHHECSRFRRKAGIWYYVDAVSES